jgi:16S rRNA (guanine966-N2)-methyltransferase
MRVIAGKYRSRPLSSMRGMDIRPTADRLRETLFDVLTAGNPEALEGSTWIDLYAGTGAVGIEALSRGARMVYFVESGAAPTQLIRKNLKSLGIDAAFEILNMDGSRGVQNLGSRNIVADYIFLDPPYRLEEEYVKVLDKLSQSSIITPTTIAIAEHHKKFDPGQVFSEMRRSRKLVQGDAILSFFRRV